MNKFMRSILVLTCCYSAIAFGTEDSDTRYEMTTPEACPESDNCPRDSHPIGTPCPHNPN